MTTNQQTIISAYVNGTVSHSNARMGLRVLGVSDDDAYTMLKAAWDGDKDNRAADKEARRRSIPGA